MGQVTPNMHQSYLNSLNYNPQVSNITSPALPYTLPQQQPILNKSRVSNKTTPVLNLSPTKTSQIQSQAVLPIQYPSTIGSNRNIPFFGSESRIADIPSQLIFTPELGATGSSMKKPNEIIRQKRLTFQGGLQELLSIRQSLRSNKLYFSKILPILQLEINKIYAAIESQLQSGIQDKSKLLYHLAQEKNYKLILTRIFEWKHQITLSIDTLRKKNNVSREQFVTIINIANESTSFAKKLVKEMPVNGWNAILTNNNTSIYNQIVTQAQKDPQILQAFKTIASNARNNNYQYAKPKEPENLYQSRTFTIVEGPNPTNPAEFSPTRPNTPKPQPRRNSLIG